MTRKEYNEREVRAHDRNCVSCGRKLRPEQQCLVLGEAYCTRCVKQVED